MFQTFTKAWKIPEVRKKILYTLLLILIFRIGSFIPVPGVNPEFISQQASNYDILGFLDLMTGGNFGNFTIFALGISPYINASIIIQLLTVAIPALENMAKEGEEGRKKIERITRLLGMVFALIMSIGIIVGMGTGAVVASNIIPNWMSYMTIGLVITAGTAFLMWLSEQITQIGIGNGTSFIIFAGIVSRIPMAIVSFVQNIGFSADNVHPVLVPIIVIGILVIIAGVTLVDLGERKIPIQYSKRVVGRKQYGGQSSNIPIRVNSNGVMPLIFASTLLQFPGMIAQFWPQSGFYQWYVKYLASGTWLYMLIYMVLIIAFAYFYTAITFNPIEMSKNLQANGGYIHGIRPGKPTSDYIGKISSRLTLFSAFFLAIVAAVPTLMKSLGAGSSFASTSLLIMVSVALETNKSLEAQVTMRHYKGFLQ